MSDTRNITIQGVIFPVTSPYAAGPCELSEAEANALNQVRAENIRNNFASKMKKKRDELELDKDAPFPQEVVDGFATELAAYDESYEFTLASAGGGRAPVDPIEKEAIKLAKSAIQAHLSAQGVTVKAYKEVNEDQYNDTVAKLAASKEFRTAAEKAVRERDKLASAGLEGLLAAE